MCTDFKSDLKMGSKVDMSSLSSCPSDLLVVSQSHHCTFALSGTLFQLPLLTFWLLPNHAVTYIESLEVGAGKMSQQLNTGCSSGGPGFNSQDLRGDSQLSVTTVLGNPTPSHGHTCRKNTNEEKKA